MPATDHPPLLAPAHERAQLARLDADLAAARLRRERLDYSSAVGQYTAGCRGRRSPEELARALAQLDAELVELQERREALMGTPFRPPQE